MTKRIVNRIAYRLGYVIVRVDAREALRERLASARKQVQPLTDEVKLMRSALTKANRRLADRTLELEETRLKLQRALRAELQRLFTNLK